jgi:hypothetical protein
METRVQRALQNRWLATAATIAVAYIGVRVMFWVLEDAYYNYYLYPQIKGAEYNYPELRYTFGQVAIFLWSFMGLCTAALVGRCTLLRTEDKWAARSAIAFVLGFVLLVVGFVAGMAMRDSGSDLKPAGPNYCKHYTH